MLVARTFGTVNTHTPALVSQESATDTGYLAVINPPRPRDGRMAHNFDATDLKKNKIVYAGQVFKSSIALGSLSLEANTATSLCLILDNIGSFCYNNHSQISKHGKKEKTFECDSSHHRPT